jgi:DNA-binding NarL/FixJ family response regulator
MIRVVLADDHAVVRGGIALVVRSADDIELVGIAANGAEALAAVRKMRPDVVLMDLEMPLVDGIEATRAITTQIPSTKVVALTAFSDRGRILAVLDAGAVGYVLKDAEPRQVLDAIRAAAHGASPLDPRVAHALLDERRARPASELTERERDVVRLLGRGYPNKRIAKALGISEKTVKTHLTSAFRRIGVFDRTQAALWAQRNLESDQDQTPAP